MKSPVGGGGSENPNPSRLFPLLSLIQSLVMERLDGGDPVFVHLSPSSTRVVANQIDHKLQAVVQARMDPSPAPGSHRLLAMAPWQLAEACGQRRDWWAADLPVGEAEGTEATEFWRPPHKVIAVAFFLDIATSRSRRCRESPSSVFVDYLAPSTPRHPSIPIVNTKNNTNKNNK